jgi:hypothetical protein
VEVEHEARHHSYGRAAEGNREASGSAVDGGQYGKKLPDCERCKRTWENRLERVSTEKSTKVDTYPADLFDVRNPWSVLLEIWCKGNH